MKEETLQLFKMMTELQGAAGFEHEVRRFMRKEMEPFADEIIQDRLGSIFAVKKGDPNDPRVMVAGHMDEVGFMVTGITEMGLLRFQALGGWWNQVLLAQRVQVMTDNGAVVGVISSIPPHLLDEAKRSKPMNMKDMLIDIGADNAEDAKKLGIKLGQQIVPVSPFTPMANEKKLLAKAWDNRFGCSLAVELLKETKGETLPNTLFIGATAQEEVGLRGGQTAARMINPDIFFCLEASPANDMSGSKSEFGYLGKGALIRMFDRTMIAHPRLREFVLDTAESNHIPYQNFTSPGGGTDAGAVHISNNGVPTTVIGVPSRYIHTSASIIHTDDYMATKELVSKLIRAMDKTTLDTIKGE